MNADQFRQAARRLVDWVADYLDGAERFPVLPIVNWSF